MPENAARTVIESSPFTDATFQDVNASGESADTAESVIVAESRNTNADHLADAQKPVDTSSSHTFGGSCEVAFADDTFDVAQSW